MEKYDYYKEVANDIECWMDKDGDPFNLSQFGDRERRKVEWTEGGDEVGMTKQRMIELIEIEHECMLRKSHDVCDGNC